MPLYQPSLTQERWQQFGLYEQLGNVGSEVHRALQWKNKDEALYQNSMYRAFELIDMTIKDPRWRNSLKELVRVREALGDAMYEGKEYGSTLEDLDNYFFQFALATRVHK